MTQELIDFVVRPLLPNIDDSEKKTCQIARNRYSLRNDESATDTAKATRGHATCEEKIVEGFADGLDKKESHYQKRMV
ncbi:Centrosomal protein of 164 kDa [Manis javanica]|nr:Centrosomal protein of 164 kDa [Manis javanica]